MSLVSIEPLGLLLVGVYMLHSVMKELSPRDFHILNTSTSGASAEMSPHIVPLPKSEIQCFSSTKGL